MRWSYYLHTNGDIIGKNAVVLDNDPDYFDSPFVIKYWIIDTDNRETLVRFLSKVKQLLDRVENKERTLKRIKEIEDKSNVVEKDYECLRRVDAGEDYNKVLKEIFGE